MSAAQKRGFAWLSFALTAGLALVAGLAALHAANADKTPTLRITLAARGMAFYLEGDDTPNPTLTIPADSTIEIRLRNEDRGSLHDLACPDLGLRTMQLSAGRSQTIRFRTPAEPGRSQYRCTLHPIMMRGEIRVVAPSGAPARGGQMNTPRRAVNQFGTTPPAQVRPTIATCEALSDSSGPQAEASGIRRSGAPARLDRPAR